MSIYAIGDVQGCYKELIELLSLIQFNSDKDTLWFTGDLVNRGPQSLEVLRFVKNLGESAITVLGNHDLHCLAVAENLESLNKSDTFQDVLNAEDAKDLLYWLRHRPLLHVQNQFLLVHAGIAPQWDMTTALSCSKEIEAILQGSNYKEYLQQMYGNSPTCWDNALTSYDRFRVIVNYFTRMRFIDQKGGLELTYKGGVGSQQQQPHHLIPWFNLPSCIYPDIHIIFGHWAALEGKTGNLRYHALDSGCCWGNALTAMRLEDLSYFSVTCHYSGVDYE